MKHSYPKAFVGLMIFMLASLATALSAPITLELSAGCVIKGNLVSWNGQQAVVKAEFGQRLELLSGGPQKLVARITELEATVEGLRKDNATLRQQLQIATTTQPLSPAPAISREVTRYSTFAPTFSASRKCAIGTA
jgi:hypothetical protein